MMQQNISPLKHKPIAQSVQKLQKAASESRFRIKSFRVKTTDNQVPATEKDYESQLISKGFTKTFLKVLSLIKSEQTQIKTSDVKYLAFVRSLHQRIFNTKKLSLAQFNFQKKSGQYFLKHFTKINNFIICYDLSFCVFFSNENSEDQVKVEEEREQNLVTNLIKNDRRIVKIILKNMSLNAEGIQQILKAAVESEKIYELDLSNESSQSMNRIGERNQILIDFFKQNSTTVIVRMENLNLRKQGVENIQKGISMNVGNPLKFLYLKNNSIGQQASLHISMLARSGLVALDISENPLGPNFYLNLPSWKSSTLRSLDLSMTQMNSEALIYFLSKLEENKSMQFLKMDKNDFSHHWFNQTKEVLEVNTSIEHISMVDCKIKRLCETFKGIYHNRYLKKINLSFNQFNEGVNELCELLKVNKILHEIRLKFCGLKTQDCIKIFRSLAENVQLSLLDVSQNYIGEEGAKQLLKSLNVNGFISCIIIEKAQIPLKLKKQIEERILANKTIKKNREFNKLKRENKVVKQLDVHSWEDVDQLEKKIRTNTNNVRIVQKKVNQLEKQYDIKKGKFNSIMKEYSDRVLFFQKEIEGLSIALKSAEKQEQNLLKKYSIRQKNILEQMRRQEEHILKLENSIQEQSLRNRERESELEDELQNKKYLVKKKEENKAKNVKIGFDATSAVNSKRKGNQKI